MKHSHPVFEITNDESIPEEWRNQILDDCFNQKKSKEDDTFEMTLDLEEKNDRRLSQKNELGKVAIDSYADNHKFRQKDNNSFESFQEVEEDAVEEETSPHERDNVSVLSSAIELGTEYSLTKSMNTNQHRIMMEGTNLPPSSQHDLISARHSHSQNLSEESIDKQTQTDSCDTNYYCNSADVSSQTDNYITLHDYDSYTLDNKMKHEECDTIEKLEQTIYDPQTSAIYLGKSSNKEEMEEDSIHSNHNTMILSLKKLLFVWVDEFYKAILRKNIMCNSLESSNKAMESKLMMKDLAIMNYKEEIKNKSNEISKINQCHQEERELLKEKIKLMETNSQILEQKYKKLQMETTINTKSTEGEHPDIIINDKLVDDETKLQNNITISSPPMHVNRQSLYETDFMCKLKIELISHSVEKNHTEIIFKMIEFKEDMHDKMSAKKHRDLPLECNFDDVVDFKNSNNSIGQTMKRVLLKSLNSSQVPNPSDMKKYQRIGQIKSNIYTNRKKETEIIQQNLQEQFFHPEVKPDPDGIIVSCCISSDERQLPTESKKNNHHSIVRSAIQSNTLFGTEEETIKKLRQLSEFYKKQFLQQTSLTKRLAAENNELKNIVQRKDLELSNHMLNETKLKEKLYESSNSKSSIEHQYKGDKERLPLPVITKAVTHSPSDSEVEISEVSEENKTFINPSEQLSTLEILTESILTDFILEQKNHS